MRLAFFFLVCMAVSISVKSFAGTKDQVLSLEQLKSRFEVKGEIFYFDSDGKKLLSEGSEWRSWKPRIINEQSQIESQWSSKSLQNGDFAIHHSWTIQDDGSIKVLIEEFSKEEEGKKADGERDTKFTDLLKKEEKILTDFSSISWVSIRPNQKRRVVVRFTPYLSKGKELKKMTELPISGSEILITDNQGNLWTEHNTLSGKYVGFTTRKGSIFMSYYPFKGATEIGFAFGNRIELHLEGKKVATLTSQTAFLPDEVRAIVYGIYRPDQKTGRLSSTHTRTSNEEDGFLSSINQAEAQ